MKQLPNFYPISTRLRRWREYMKLTQDDMAKIAGMKQSNESKIESGKQHAHYDHIIKWAEMAGVSPEDFICTDPPTVTYYIQSQQGENIAHQIVQHAVSSESDLIENLKETIKSLEHKFELYQQQSNKRIAELKAYISDLKS